MTLSDMVFALLPAIGMFFLVGLSANWLQEMAEQYARKELRFDEESERLREIYDRVTEWSHKIDQEKETRAERERTLSQLQAQHGEAMTEEIRLTDPRQLTVYEHGVPTANSVGYYAKALGPAHVPPFDGRGSASSGVHGRRVARFIVWGQAQANAERLVKHWVGSQGQITEFRPFSGKLKLTEL